MIQLPARIGKYELEEFLGGGMSEVYRARDQVIGRTVAVKILTAAGCADADVRDRFLAEARMAGNISHENIISIYDFGEDEQKRPFMVMEFLRGEDLRHAIDQGRTGDLVSKLKIAVQVARALEYIHTQKIVHRDIKPENVHINAAGVVKLMDFGIAKTEGLSMTRAGYVLGTPFYMAPEQVTGRGITPQVDVYAFGIMLFELISGAKPIKGDTVERIFYSILNEPLNLEPLVQAGAPEAVCDAGGAVHRQRAGAAAAGLQPDLRRTGAADRRAERADRGGSGACPVRRPRRGFPSGCSRREPPCWSCWWREDSTWRCGPAPATRRAAGPRDPNWREPSIPRPAKWCWCPRDLSCSARRRCRSTLPAFYIDRTEVTNAEYAAFCKATGYKLPEKFPDGKPDYPVVNVTIVDAHAFANWAGKRLPNSKEWEKAARGEDGRLYPWGDQPDMSKANIHSNGPRPVTDLRRRRKPIRGAPDGGQRLGVRGAVEPAARRRTQLAYFRQMLKPPPGPNEPWYLIRGESFVDPISRSGCCLGFRRGSGPLERRSTWASAA